MSYLMYSPGLRLQEPRAAAIRPWQGICLVRNSNRVPPEHNSVTTVTMPFIYFLFNDAAIIAECMAWNSGVICG
jgi:hypothetical protein